MADELKIPVKVTADTTGAKQTVAALKEVEGAAKQAAAAVPAKGKGNGFSEVIDGLSGVDGLGGLALATAGPLAVATAGVGALVGVLGGAMNAFSESEEAALLLSNALKVTGQASADAQGKIEQMAAQMQDLTGIADETWIGVAAKMIQFGVAAQEIPDAFPIIEGLAGRMGGDVAAAGEMFARTMAGNVRGLVMFGEKLEDGATKEQRFAALARIAATGAGLLEEKTHTLAGSLKQVSAGFADLLENTGTWLNSGGRIAQTFEILGLGLRSMRDGTWSVYGQAVKEASGAQENAGRVALASARAMTTLGTSTDKATAAFKAGASPTEETIRRLEKMRSAAASTKAAMDDLAQAQRDLDLARIESKVASKEMTPEEGDRAKASITGRAEQAGITRQQREASNARTSKEVALRNLERQQLAERKLPAGPAPTAAEEEAKAAEFSKREDAKGTLRQEIAALSIKLKALEKNAEASKLRTGAAVQTIDSQAGEKAAEAAKKAAAQAEEERRAVREGLAGTDSIKGRSPEATAKIQALRAKVDSANSSGNAEAMVKALEALEAAISKSAAKGTDPDIVARLNALEAKIQRGK